MVKTFIYASQAQVDDVLQFSFPRESIEVGKITIAGCDGWIGIHAHNASWRAYYKPTDRVPVILAG